MTELLDYMTYTNKLPETTEEDRYKKKIILESILDFRDSGLDTNLLQ